MHILPLYAALLALVFFYLSIRVIALRRKLKIGIGTSDNQDILRAVRVHANFTEYTPFALFLIYLVEVLGGAGLLVHGLGLCLLLGRVVHAYGVSQHQEKLVFRVCAMVMTFTVMLVSAVFLVCTYFCGV